MSSEPSVLSAREMSASTGAVDAPPLVHLRSGGVSVVLDLRDGTLPRILHWGADLGDLDGPTLGLLAKATTELIGGSNPDVPVMPSILPEQALGWTGTPGLAGHRDGIDFAPLFSVTSAVVESSLEAEPNGSTRLIATAVDDAISLGLIIEIELTASGLLRTRATLTNHGEHYTLDALTPQLPVPIEATEILDFAGRHARERSPQRRAFTMGTHLREGRHGRTGLDATLLIAAGSTGFGFRSGAVWAVHTAWSGNHRTFAERTHLGSAVLGGGELLLAGEVVLGREQSYSSPWLYGSYGTGLDAVSSRFHRWMRARPRHPHSARPVVLNTWEAVYFDQDLPTLSALADAAAAVGVERFVLDDGWFLGRHDDRAGLGDWVVDPTTWPEGLGPLASHVHGLGMQFGLWFEPEMVNPDSELARAHPEWILSTPHRTPMLSRGQLVLDLTHDGAFEHVSGQISTLVDELGIDFIKWDHNRDLLDPGHLPAGGARVHEQTRAVYRMLELLHERHPRLEIESCSSGGGRADLGILEYTERIWASDSIDALERQGIQRWTSSLLPLELLGSHIGGPVSHTTGRTHSLAFRAGTALFGSLGIEWDISKLSARDSEALRSWIALYKREREMLHSGELVRVEHPDPAVLVHGVVANDRSRALFAFVAVDTSMWSPRGRARLDGLDPSAKYRVSPVSPGGAAEKHWGAPRPAWWEGVTLPGSVLMTVGLTLPQLDPEELQLVLLERMG